MNMMTDHWTNDRSRCLDTDSNERLEHFMSFLMKASSLTSLAARLMCDDDGADLIEYALLTALFGLMGFLSFTSLSPKMSSAYSGWDNGEQGLWIPPQPAGS
jgi:Flp pilus assembly pilin Flp